MFNNPFEIFLLIAILTVVSIILYKVWNNKSTFTNNSSISLLQWNTHYECFVKNTTDCCSKPLVAYLNKMLPTVDFANLSMFEKTGYTPPSGYITIDQFSDKPAFECGYDITTLIYNSNRWEAVGKPIYGCLITNDRAYIIQQFKEKSAGSKPVYVIGSHWSHPAQGQSYPSDSTAALAKALSDNNIHSTDRIILLADTNDSFPDKPTPDSVLMNAILGGKATNVQGTGPRQTCCCSDPPQGSGPFPFKTDRIISNFGTGGNVQIPELTDIFGSIAQCPPPKNPLLGSCVFGEMHKPVFWKLQL